MKKVKVKFNGHIASIKENVLKEHNISINFNGDNIHFKKNLKDGIYYAVDGTDGYGINIKETVKGNKLLITSKN